MYNFQADLRNKSTDSVYFNEKGGYYNLIIEEYENKLDIKLNYKQISKFAIELFNSVQAGTGAQTYNELLDKIDTLEEQLKIN